MFKKHTTKYSLKTFGLIFSFVLIYSTTGILLAQQVALFAHKKNTQVKNEEFTIPEAGRVTNENTIEELHPTNDKPTISIYVVQKGDTIASIAKQFDISANTVRFANDLSSKDTLKVGAKLVILPVTGIDYKVQKGDTISSIAKRFHADQKEILDFNDIDGTKIKIGMDLIIPNAEPLSPTKEKVSPKTPEKKIEDKKEIVSTPKQEKTTAPTPVVQQAPIVSPSPVESDTPESNVVQETKKISDGYFIHPMPGSRLSQSLHGYNSVDFAAPLGTPILAAADGIVIVAKKDNGFSGGYGNYIVISHANGTQTLYSHLSKVSVNVEDVVKQGDEIGKCGRTGRATGNHLHFEVRGGINPWVGKKVGTTF